MSPKLAVVTAMIDPDATRKYWESWRATADSQFDAFLVLNGGGPGSLDFRKFEPLISCTLGGQQIGTLLVSSEIMGPVRAFAWGVREAAKRGAEMIACFHDDLEILAQGWDSQVMEFFESRPVAILAGFGGGIRLGDPTMYARPYDPMSLARHDFISNMRDAEAHGRRVTSPTRVACLDGFSQIGRATFIADAYKWLDNHGIVHHGYDSAIGALAARHKDAEVWMLPLQCHHAGGVTAVANASYHTWADKQIVGGDQGFWQASHRIIYDELRDILPIGW